MNAVVKREARRLAAGVALLACLFLAGTAVAGYLDSAMVISVLLGSAYAMGNFLLLGFSVERSLEKEPGRAKSVMVSGYVLRYLLMGLFLFLGVKLPFLNFVGMAVPLLFPKLILFARSVKRPSIKDITYEERRENQ